MKLDQLYQAKNIANKIDEIDQQLEALSKDNADTNIDGRYLLTSDSEICKAMLDAARAIYQDRRAKLQAQFEAL
jgi:hypothetical protein